MDIHVSLKAEELIDLGFIQITNSMISMWIVMGIIILFVFLGTRKVKMVPSGFQNFFEFIVESLFNYFDAVFQDRKKTKKYFSLLASFFLLIIFSNWIGVLMELVPIKINLGGHEVVHLFRSANTDLNTTLSLALISVSLIQIFGVWSLGFKGYIGKFINFTSPINFFVGILELVSEMIKIVTLSFRLFGNIFGGGVILLVITELASKLEVYGKDLILFGVPAPFYALEIFVGFIQALVFTTLSLIFIKMATDEHH